MTDPAEAEAFSRAQHAGSLGPALVLNKLVDLAGRRALLDVAGGSGAFSITLCLRYPDLQATILDFPNVTEVVNKFIAEDRIATLGGGDFEPLFAKAFAALKPIGLFVVHDFMLDDDRMGPELAAHWFLMSTTFHSQTISFSSQAVSDQLQAAGFATPSVDVLIPEITKVVVCLKPA